MLVANWRSPAVFLMRESGESRGRPPNQVVIRLWTVENLIAVDRLLQDTKSHTPTYTDFLSIKYLNSISASAFFFDLLQPYPRTLSSFKLFFMPFIIKPFLYLFLESSFTLKSIYHISLIFYFRSFFDPHRLFLFLLKINIYFCNLVFSKLNSWQFLFSLWF